MSEPVKTTSELIGKYAGILENIVRHGTQGSYTYQGVLGCFLNEWIELSPSERDWDTQEGSGTAPQTPDEFTDLVDEVLKGAGIE